MARHLRRIVTCMLFGFIAAARARAGATRVAVVVPGGSDARAGQIASVAEALLGQGDDVQLVERQQIDRLLREQQISLSGAIDAEHAIKVGHVLSADVLASVEMPPGSKTLGLVAFDTGTGVRLCDRTIAEERDEQCARIIARGIMDSLSKRQHVDSLRTICLMSARNADLPRGMDGFCDAVGRLLERDLVRSDGIALLERSRLEQVTRERALAEDAGRRQLLASLVVIHLDVARHDAGLSATALLSDASGKSLGKATATAPAEDAAFLATSLATAVARNANLPHGFGPLDTRPEAERFAAEAAFRMSHAEYPRAIAPAEAAHALGPGNLRYRAALAQALIDSAKMIDYGHPPAGVVLPLPEQAPPMADRGAQALVEVGARYDAADAATRAAVDPVLADAVEELCDYIDWTFLPKRPGGPVQQPAELPQVQSALREYLLRANARRRATVRDVPSFQVYSRQLAQFLSDDQWMAARNSGEWTGDYAAAVNDWLALLAQYPDSNPAAVREVLQAIAIDWALERHRHVRVLDRTPRLLRWDLTPTDLERLQSVARALGSRPDEATKRYGDLESVTIAVVRAQDSPQTMYRLVDAFVEQAERRVADPAMKARPDARRFEYHLAYLADALLDKTPDAGRCANAILDFALARHEYYRPFLDGITGRRYRPIRDAGRAAAIDRDRRILATLDAPDFVNLSNQSIPGLRAACLNDLHNLGLPGGAPAVAAPATQPWVAKRTLADVRDALDGVEWLLAPVVHDGTLYAAAVDRAGSDGPATLRLITMPLDGRPSHLGRRLPIELMMPKSDPNSNISNSLSVVRDACVFEGRYCVPTLRQGLYLFPLDGSPPSLLDTRHGLPADGVDAVSGLDGVLYLGMNAGYLIAYDLSSKRADVLAASRRKDRQSPFDDGPPFQVCGLVPDPARRRMIVVVTRNDPEAAASGVWEFKPAAHGMTRWRRLAAMSPEPPSNLPLPPGPRGGPIRPITYVGKSDGTRFPLAAPLAVYDFDLAADAVERLAHGGRHVFGLPPPADLPRYPAETDAGEQALLARRVFNRIAILDGEWLWDNGNADGWGRTNLKSGQRQQFGTPRDQGGRFSPEFIEPVDDGARVVVGDQFGMWVLTLKQGTR